MNGRRFRAKGKVNPLDCQRHQAKGVANPVDWQRPRLESNANPLNCQRDEMEGDDNPFNCLRDGVEGDANPFSCERGREEGDTHLVDWQRHSPSMEGNPGVDAGGFRTRSPRIRSVSGRRPVAAIVVLAMGLWPVGSGVDGRGRTRLSRALQEKRLKKIIACGIDNTSAGLYSFPIGSPAPPGSLQQLPEERAHR